ncbi:hypothetical protein SPWS13_4283 [Shewanella putrefaciens]|nr:hypothetical protein SPWS13_4283 [Shewanella putrefaciens]
MKTLLEWVAFVIKWGFHIQGSPLVITSPDFLGQLALEGLF